MCPSCLYIIVIQSIRRSRLFDYVTSGGNTTHV